MAGQAVNVRLPEWATEFVEERSKVRRESKTQVIVEALSCLRGQETEDLMREGYMALRQESVALAEEGMAAGAETLPEW